MSTRRIGPDEAYRLVCEEGYLYLDVRTVAEFDTGHPRGAYNLPWQEPGPHGLEVNARFVEVASALFDEGDRLVVGCASGVRSREAAEALRAAGFREIAEQREGFEGVRDPFGGQTARGWRGAGLPCSYQAVTGRSYAELLKRL